MQPGKYEFLESFLEEHGIKFVGYYRNVEMKLKTYH